VPADPDQTISPLRTTAPDTDGSRLIMLLGSQTVCGGAFKNLYTRAWRLSANQITPVLDATVFGNDGYPPIDGRLRRDEVLVKYTAGGRLDGDPHTAVRRWRITGNTATPIDPIAVRPLDFVLEWIAAPWDESRAHSESAALQSAHAQLSRTDDAGDFPDATLKCTSGDDLWQVTTKLFEGQKMYYRVRWTMPITFSMVAVSNMPFADCTLKDERGDAYPNVFNVVR